MGRTVTARVTHAGVVAGSVGPFEVDVPWWADVAPVAGHLEAVLGVPVVVLRLLGVDGSDGARDGHVTYHVEALKPVTGLLREIPRWDPRADHPLRMPWARMEGIEELLAWAGRHVDVVGRPVQHRTWNLSGLWRLPTRDGVAWLKALPPFAAAEPLALEVLSDADPGVVPQVLATAPGRLLLADVPGRDGWDASAADVVAAVRHMATTQALVAWPDGDERLGRLPDRRSPVTTAAVQNLLDGPAGTDLSHAERDAAHALRPRWERLEECGLPATLVHGDFHPGNWRCGGGQPVVLDLADAHLGNPVLDGLRAVDFLPPARRAVATTAWIDVWKALAPGSQPAEALRIAAPLAHLVYAVRYQEFLDGIEPDERVYHAGDPVTSIRRALAMLQPQTGT